MSRILTSFSFAQAEEATKLTSDTEVANNTFTAPTLQDGQNAFNAGNYDLAFAHWQTLATQGHADAQVFVGLSYANGWGVDKSTKLASHWFKKAALSENASGQFLLGLYLITGKDADLPLGVMWLKRAAENGDESARRFMKPSPWPTTSSYRIARSFPDSTDSFNQDNSYLGSVLIRLTSGLLFLLEATDVVSK